MLNLQERSPETIQNPGTDTKILFNDSTDGLLKTKDSSGVVETLATTDAIADTEPKVYVALLTQTGTNAPVATVLKNTLGGTVVWTYDSAGIYIGTLIGVFTLDKTYSIISQSISNLATSVVYRTSANTVQVLSAEEGNVVDDILSNTSIKIEVYP